MPQISSWTIANSGGSTYRAAVNSALAAVQSSSSGTAAPSPTVAGMLWYDTTNSILKRRNTANTGWIDVSLDAVGATTVRGNASTSAAAEADVSMASLRTMIGFPTSTTGLGHWTTIYGAVNTPLVMLSGGTWAYLYLTQLSSGAVISYGAGVVPGGTTLRGAVTTESSIGFAWRIA